MALSCRFQILRRHSSVASFSPSNSSSLSSRVGPLPRLLSPVACLYHYFVLSHLGLSPPRRACVLPTSRHLLCSDPHPLCPFDPPPPPKVLQLSKSFVSIPSDGLTSFFSFSVCVLSFLILCPSLLRTTGPWTPVLEVLDSRPSPPPSWTLYDALYVA